MKEKKFLVTFKLEEKHLQYLAADEGLSIEQLTDDKLIELLTADLRKFFNIPIDLTPAPQE